MPAVLQAVVAATTQPQHLLQHHHPLLETWLQLLPINLNPREVPVVLVEVVAFPWMRNVQPLERKFATIAAKLDTLLGSAPTTDWKEKIARLSTKLVDSIAVASTAAR